MKAAVLHGIDDIRYEEYETPATLPGTIKVRVMAAGICGSDIPRVLQGKVKKFPLVLGHEFSGYVTEVGEGVTKFAVGDHVAGAPLLPCMNCPDCARGNYSQCKQYSFVGSRVQGAFADYVVLPEKNAVKIDNALSFEQGALFEPCTVGLHGVRLANFTGGKRVAVIGGGTIGFFTMQWAKIFGARQLVVFDINKDRLDFCKRCGATDGICTLDEDYRDQAMALTEGNGFDYVFETCGVPDTIKMAMDLAANKAHVCYIGTPSSPVTFEPLEWENLNRKELSVTGSWMSYSAPFPGEEWVLTAHYFATGDLIYDPDAVYEKFPMSDAAKAFELYKTPGLVKGRVLLYNED